MTQTLENEAHKPDASAQPAWLWWSTAESVKAGVPSVFAIIETMLAVMVYWMIAWRYGTYWPLLLSAIIAPLVLLRSEESVALGVKWWARIEKNWHKPAQEWCWGEWLVLVLAFLATTGTSYVTAKYLAETYIVGLTGWQAFVGGFGAGAIAIVVAITVAITVAVAGTAAVTGAVTGVRAVEVAGAGAGIIAGVVAGTGTVTGVGAALTMVAVLAMVAAGKRLKPFARLSLMFFRIPLVLGFGIGFFLLSLVVRFCATIRYILIGLCSLPQNFQRLAFAMSPCHEPELVPGLPKGAAAHFSYARSRWAHENYLNKAFLLPVFLIWFLPAWLYRIMLKSTAWLWWPLAFVGSPPKRAQNPEDFHEDVRHSLWGKTVIALSLVTLFGFFYYALTPPLLNGERNPLIHVLGYLFLIDWSKIQYAQGLLLALAVLAIIILYWLDDAFCRLRRALRDKKLADERWARGEIARIERLSRIRPVLFAIYVGLFGFHTVLVLNAKSCWFTPPQHVQSFALTLYGDLTPPPPDCAG